MTSAACSKTLLIAVVAAVAIGVATAADKPRVNVDRGSLALGGYDAVAYFENARPVKGSAQFEHRWSGAVWRFASATNRDRFAQEPARYAPQFGGYCAWAVSQGYTANGDPQVWRIVGGKLYLNYNRQAKQLWEQDVPGNIKKGEANWPGVLSR